MKSHLELKTKDFDKGNYIFRQFESGQEAFIIKSGRVEIIKTFTENNVSTEKVLDVLEPGAVFGEIALIDSKPRMASAKASSDNVSLHILTQSKFEEMLDTTNPFIKKLLSILTTLVRSKDN